MLAFPSRTSNDFVKPLNCSRVNIPSDASFPAAATASRTHVFHNPRANSKSSIDDSPELSNTAASTRVQSAANSTHCSLEIPRTLCTSSALNTKSNFTSKPPPARHESNTIARTDVALSSSSSSLIVSNTSSLTSIDNPYLPSAFVSAVIDIVSGNATRRSLVRACPPNASDSSKSS